MRKINDIEKFQAVLDDTYEWPADYTFKFIVPSAKENELMDILVDCQVQRKASEKGNYISFTSKIEAKSSQEVVDVYAKVKVIDGLISL